MRYPASTTAAGRGKVSRAQRAARRRPSEMRLCFTFRHCEPTEALKAFAERKFARIAKSLKRSCEVHLIFSVDKYRQSGEATVKSGRFSFVAQTTDKDLYAVIDGLIDKVDRQLKDHLHRAETGRTRALSAAEALAEA